MHSVARPIIFISIKFFGKCKYSWRQAVKKYPRKKKQCELTLGIDSIHAQKYEHPARRQE